MGRFSDGNESSSSTESGAPRRRKARSFSPTSDDDAVVKTVDDDTPPPPDRPILRQGVFGGGAFGSSAFGSFGSSKFFQAAKIQTYKEDAPKDSTPKPLLPGMGGAINGQTIESLVRPQQEASTSRATYSTPPPRTLPPAESSRKANSMPPPPPPLSPPPPIATMPMDGSAEPETPSPTQTSTSHGHLPTGMPSSSGVPSGASSSAQPGPSFSQPIMRPHSMHPSLFPHGPPPQQVVYQSSSMTPTVARKPRKQRAPNTKPKRTGEEYKEKKGRFRLNTYNHEVAIPSPAAAVRGGEIADLPDQPTVNAPFKTPSINYKFAPPIVQTRPPPQETAAAERFKETALRERKRLALLEKSAPPSLPSIPANLFPPQQSPPAPRLISRAGRTMLTAGSSGRPEPTKAPEREPGPQPSPDPEPESHASAPQPEPAPEPEPELEQVPQPEPEPEPQPPSPAPQSPHSRQPSAQPTVATAPSPSLRESPRVDALPDKAANSAPGRDFAPSIGSRTEATASPAPPNPPEPVAASPAPSTTAPLAAPSPAPSNAPPITTASPAPSNVPPVAAPSPAPSVPPIEIASPAPSSTPRSRAASLAPSARDELETEVAPANAKSPPPRGATPSSRAQPTPPPNTVPPHPATPLSTAGQPPSAAGPSTRPQLIPVPKGTETDHLVPAPPNPSYYPTAVSNLQPPPIQESVGSVSKYYRERPKKSPPPPEKAKTSSAPRAKRNTNKPPDPDKLKKSREKRTEDSDAQYIMYTAPNQPPPPADPIPVPAVSSAAKGKGKRKAAPPSQGGEAVNVGAYESVFSKDDDFMSTPTLTSATFDYDGNTPEPRDTQEHGVQSLAARTISQRPGDAQRRGSDPQAQGNMPPPGNNHWAAQGGSRDVDMEPPQSSAPADPLKLMRIVTLLIEDTRYGNADPLLAEVRVPLKIDHDGGFWADAKDICDQLQGSPSRIDGPAKVFTMRGRYRQIFLRVSDDNVDTSTSMNVAVSLERTIEVYVEPLKPPIAQPPNNPPPPPVQSPASEQGYYQQPPPPLPPRSAWDDPYNEPRRGQSSRDYYPPPPPPPSHRRPPPPHPPPSDYYQRQYAGPRKRKRSPSLSPDYDPPPDGDWFGLRYELQGKPFPENIQHYRNKTSYDYHTPGPSRKRRAPSGGDDRDDDPGPIYARVAPVRHEFASDEEEDREYDSPAPGDTEDRLHEKIASAVDHEFLQKEPRWKEFFKARSRAQNVKNILAQYEIAHEMIVKYVGRDAPFRSCRHKVETTHIMEALSIEDPRFPVDCAEVLRLLRLYGPDGKRLQHPKVIEMMNDDSPPEYNAKPMKRFLRLLKEVDQQYNAQRG